MTLEEAAKASGVIQPEHLQGFLEYLVRVPEEPEMLTGPHQKEERLQGAVLRGQPFVLVNASGRPSIREMTVVVMNNTCDLQPKRSATVTYAAASDYKTFADGIEARLGKQKAQGYLASLQRNNIHELLYVAGNGDFPDGLIVHMDRLCTLDSSLYEKALTTRKRVASFSQNGFYFFLIKLTRHLARAETEEVLR